jgi:hypothetical protein
MCKRVNVLHPALPLPGCSSVTRLIHGLINMFSYPELALPAPELPLAPNFNVKFPSLPYSRNNAIQDSHCFPYGKAIAGLSLRVRRNM